MICLMSLGLNVVDSLGILLKGAFDGELGWSRTLTKAIPLILVGIGMSIAWRSGCYNVGGEGQFLMGGLLAIMVVSAGKGLPPGLQLGFALILGPIGGLLYAGLAGLLMVYRGVNLVISTILLNFIAIFFLKYMVNGPMQESKGLLPQTDSLSKQAMLPLFNNQLTLHYGIFIALAAAWLMHNYLIKTQTGFYLKLVGSSPGAVRAIGLNVDMLKLRAMMLSGAFCGLAASVELTGITGKIDPSFSQNWGFQGIPVALVAGLNPLMCIPAGIGFGALYAGTQSLSRVSPGGDTLIYVLQAIIVFATIGVPKLFDQSKFFARFQKTASTVEGKK